MPGGRWLFLADSMQATTALEAEAAKLKEEVCDLQRLLAEQQRQPLAGNALPVPAAGARGAAQRTQAGGASTDASVLRRLEVAGEQLLQAQVLGAELRQQLAAKDAALQGESAQLCWGYLKFGESSCGSTQWDAFTGSKLGPCQGCA